MKRPIVLALAVWLFSGAPAWAQWPLGVTPPVFIFPGSAINGSGTAVTVPITIPVNGIATTPTDALILTNTTAATAAATVQMPPRLRQRGFAWDTAASQSLDWDLGFLPVSAATPTSTYRWRHSLNGAAYTEPMTLTSAGVLTTLSGVAAGGSLRTNTNTVDFGATGFLYVPADGKGQILSNAQNAGVGWDVLTDAILKIRTRAQTGYATVDALAYRLSGVPTFTSTAPTITSGFGDGGATAPAIVTGSTSTAFRITVGDGAADTAGVIGLPTATNFWNCDIWDQTTPLDVTRQTASTTTAVTFTTTIAWTAGDVLIGRCTGQ